MRCKGCNHILTDIDLFLDKYAELCQNCFSSSSQAADELDLNFMSYNGGLNE